MRRALLVSLTALVLPASASAATPWVGLQPVSGTNPAALFGPMGVYPANDLAVNASGSAIAAWVDTSSHVVAARRAPSGEWSAPAAVSTTNAAAAGGVSVAIDAAGDATVVWASSTTFFSSTAMAGGAFAPAQTIAGGFSGLQTPGIDVAMNASGATVTALSANNTSLPAYAAAAPSAGGTWGAAQQISLAGHGGVYPAVAINASGEALASFLDVTPPGGGSGSYVYDARASLKDAGGDFAGAAFVLGNPSPYVVPAPVIDDTGRAAVLVRTFATPSTVYAIRRAAGVPTFTVAGAGDTLASDCTNSTTDYGGVLALDGDGALTAAYTCKAQIRSLGRAAGGDFDASGAQVVVTTGVNAKLELDAAPSGRALLVTQAADVVRAYRRAGPAATFGAAEALVDPDDGLSLEGAGLDDAGDAVALVGKYRAVGMGQVMDEYGSLLDVTPGTAGIEGPGTAATGDLLTFSFGGTDAFGGFVGQPSWTSSDGGSAMGATFQRTFTTPGTYVIGVSRKDVGGATASATKTVVVASRPTPTATPTPSPTASPAPVTVHCVVPKLKGKTLAAARKALKKAHCKLGKVKRHGRKKLRVRKQSVKASTTLASGAKVGVTLRRKR